MHAEGESETSSHLPLSFLFINQSNGKSFETGCKAVLSDCLFFFSKHSRILIRPKKRQFWILKPETICHLSESYLYLIYRSLIKHTI